ncbi:MAG TPA: hypothetical protein VIK61_08295, partial [Acidimicrobiia bacterium]
MVASAVAVTGAVSATGASGRTAASRPAAPATPVPPFTPGFFGMSMGGDLIQLSDAKFDAELNTMKKIGVHWVRASIPWGLVQHDSQTDQEWILVDRLVETVQAEGMQL